MDGGSILPRSITAVTAVVQKIFPELFLIFLLLLLAGFFSGAETAFSFCNRLRIKQLAEASDKRAVATVKILNDFDKALVTLLIGTNICHVVAASVATLMFVRIMGDVGSVVSTAVMTLVVFIFGDTIPKNIASVNHDEFSLISAYPVAFFMKHFAPVSFVFGILSSGLKKRLTALKPAEPKYTDDELQNIVETVEEEGGLEHEESEIICSAIGFGDMKVSDVLCPKDKIVSISTRLPEKEIRDRLLSVKYSRIPVYRDNPEVFTGFLRAEEYLVAIIGGKSTDIKKHISPPMYVSSETRLSTVFEDMGKHKCHLAFVRDNTRKVIGIVTMEDILEQIVGDINDSDDNALRTGGRSAS